MFFEKPCKYTAMVTTE